MEPKVLIYHRVEDMDFDPQLLAVSLSNFEEQLKILTQDYKVISLSNMLESVKLNNLEPNTFSITFDDGYYDLLCNALPLLEKYKVHATIFITSDIVDGDKEFWWDELEKIFLSEVVLPEFLTLATSEGVRSWHLHTAKNRFDAYQDISSFLKYLKPQFIQQTLENIFAWAGLDRDIRGTHTFLTAEELKKLSESEYIEIGSHTCSHVCLSVLNEEEQLCELKESKVKLESIISRPIKILSYPFGAPGDFDNTTKKLSVGLGYDYGIANIRGFVSTTTDLQSVPRILVRNWNSNDFKIWIENNCSGPFEQQLLVEREKKALKLASPVLRNDMTVDLKKEYKIVHVNTHDCAGGAAKVAWRLRELQGSRSHMLVADKQSDESFVYNFDKDSPLVRRAYCQKNGLLYYSFQSSHGIFKHEAVKDMDIVHLHNIHGGYFNPFSMLILSMYKPVIWTLHDMQALTGHCAHSFECERWLIGCGECPHVDVYPEIAVDSSAQLWKDKKMIYDYSLPYIVVPSLWLKKKVESGILKNCPVVHIPNGVDVDVFKPCEKESIRKKYNISSDSFVVGTVAHGGAFANYWKGGEYTNKVIEKIKSECKDIVFVNIGGEVLEEQDGVLHIPFVHSEKELAELYSMFDVFLYTSIADNCPLVVLEAMACAVPIVTFNIGGIPELVVDSETGFILNFQDVDGMIEKIYSLRDNTDLSQTMSAASRKRVEERYSSKRVAKMYEQAYFDCVKWYKQRSGYVSLPSRKEVPGVVLNSDFRDMFDTLSLGLRKKKDSELSICNIDDVLAVKNKPEDIKHSEVRKLVENKKYAKALREYKVLLAEDYENGDLQMEVAQLMLKLGDEGSAQNLISNYFVKYPYDDKAYSFIKK